LDLTQVRLFTLQLSVLFSSGVPILKSLDAIAISDLPGLSPCASELRRTLEGGWPLSNAMRSLPNAFDETLVGLVRLGERTGSLGLTLHEATRRCERLLDSGKKLTQALIYPAVVLMVSLGMLAFLCFYMLPRFIPIFSSFHVDLPWPTRLLMGIVSLRGFALVVLLAVAVAVTVLLRGDHPAIRLLRQRVLFDTPVLGRYNRLTACADLCGDLSLMLRSGMILSEALDLLSRHAGWTDLSLALARTRQRMLEGDDFIAALRAEKSVPAIIVGTLAASGESGQPDRLLRSLSVLLAEEAETIRLRLTSLLEPLLILFMGVVVGFVMLGCFLPVYKLIGTEL
jgi:type II secretory pathway component PulF